MLGAHLRQSPHVGRGKLNTGTTHYFDDVSLLITHYNRSKSLEWLLRSFEKQRCVFKEIIVSDDCSKPEHLLLVAELKKRYGFRLIGATRNGGLGNNINKGQDAIRTPFTLYVQEDFVALDGCAGHLCNAVHILRDRSDIDTIRFYSYLNYPCLKPYKWGYSEMVFKPWSVGLDKFPYYSDHPHLRRSDFLKKFGRYKEGKNPENTEFDMMISYLQRRGKGLLFDNFKTVFDQINTTLEPSTMKRKFWRRSNNFAMQLAVRTYRYLKFYTHLLFVVR